jgi:K+-transporting ATPase ATPase B chain
MSNTHLSRPLFDPPLVKRALRDAFVKLDPRHQLRNPVMFTVLVGSVATTLLLIERLFAGGEESAWFIAGVSLWLWFTVLFANFAEAMAEGRGKAQADALKASRQNVAAKKLLKGREPHAAS